MADEFLPVDPHVAQAVADMAAGIRHLRTGPKACQRLAGRLDVVLRQPHRAGTVLGALGLDAPLGTAPYWRADTAFTVRLRLLREVSAHFPGPNKTARRDLLAAAARDYESRKWPKRRLLDQPPPADTAVDKLMWQLMRNAESGAAWPILERRLGDEMQRAGAFIAKTGRQDGSHERSPLQNQSPEQPRRAGAAD